MPRCRWAKTTSIETMDINNLHGHIFVLTDHGFRPYEYQAGPVPDLTQVPSTFFSELANLLEMYNLNKIVGLQIVDPHATDMFELVLPQGTIMLDMLELHGCVPTRQTGWTFTIENGKPQVCKRTEYHAKNGDKHDVFDSGALRVQLETIEDVKLLLRGKGILSAV